MVLHESTKLPGCETQSRTRKSPSFCTISSARWRGIGPWYQACERRSRESNDNSQSKAFFNATTSWDDDDDDDVGVSGDGDSWKINQFIIFNGYCNSRVLTIK